MENYIIYPKQLKRESIPVESNRCFCLMPFNRDFDIVYGTIKQYLSEKDILCNRADEITGSTPIISKILTEIIKSQYIIVDITESNPNVYYELGIAHTLKEARNVFLIKRRDYDVPFDISHLKYIEYDNNNLFLLCSTLINSIEESQSKNVLYQALNIRHIISYNDENNNDFIEYLQANEPKLIPIITKALIGESREIPSVQIEHLSDNFKKIINNLIISNNINLISKILDVFYEVFSSIPENNIIQLLVQRILNDFFAIYGLSDKNILEYKTRLAILLAKNNIYTETVLPWIIGYFSRSKSTTIDLNRYRIENFIMTTKSIIVDDAIINSLCNDDCYIREHMADIIGEKKIDNAFVLLCTQLLKETNPFTAQSMIEAIGKLGHYEGVFSIEQWVQKHKNEIIESKQYYVLKHAYFAISKIDDTREKIHINGFEDEFGQIIREYYII